MSFQKKDIPDARVMGVNSGKGDIKQNGSAVSPQNNFRTDSAISTTPRPGRERVLQPWVGPTSSDGLDLSLEKSSGGGGAWDQFAANERQFGIKSTYDENIYTTAIDKSHPQYKERMAAAERKAREIERSTATTAHVAEERVMDYVGGDDAGGDEEDKYSGVKRHDFPPLPNSRENKYTPPARRAPTASTTVKGAPVDPAIISSQLKQKNQSAVSKQDDGKPRAAPKSEATVASPAGKPAETKPDGKVEPQGKPAEAKAANQSTATLRPSATTSRTISPQAKDGQVIPPSATSTVERDVLKEFKTFANQQRLNAEKARSTKAKADKEVKLIELKKFADSFKLPTPVPMDLISIIAKDPAKQREIQEKAKRDAAEVAKRKAEEAVAKEKKSAATKEAQVTTTSQAPPENRTSRPATNAASTANAPAPRHQGNRSSFAPPYAYQGNRGGPQHIQPGGRQGNLGGRLRAIESQKAQGQDVRLPPTGPANATDPSFNRRIGGVSGHLSGKLNPNSHEFRPSAFAPTFSPNGHPSAGSSPRSAVNHATDIQPANSATTHALLLVVTKKKKAVDRKKCNILAFVKTIQPPETKNWNENDGLRPSYDTPPTWRSATDDEKPDSTMRLSYDEYFERQPFNAQPTPNPPHLLPQMAHQHQLPLHMQHGAHPSAPRHSPHVPPVQVHGQHGPVPHAPFNGADDHRMMHSNSSQSYSSPRMGQVPMVYPPNMNSAQMPYNQHMMPTFMGPGGAPPMNQFNRSFSNTPQYVPPQQGGMGAPMMMQPQFMTPQPMVAAPPQMQPYPAGGHLQFMPPGTTPPQPMPGTNGYPSPGRPAATMMAHQGSQQGQPMYGMSPGMQYQQPVTFVPQQQGQSKWQRRYSNQGKKTTNTPGEVNNMRGYNNPGPQQQFGTSPQQVHQYGPPHRNGSNNFKNYQNHNQHQGPQGAHAIPSGPQGRSSDGPDEAK
ncbi:hypothetical protein F4805DRAFT_465379 [Annulohypoxylon moriforme]|nr:hypothetical protein F4805DRAFT_465379 [Annulohypoxylon moriforme]